MKRIRLLIADDHPLFLEGIRAVFEPVEDIEIVGTAESGTQVLSLIPKTRPDFVLLDYLMPHVDGLACLDTIRKRHPEVKVALISAFKEPEVIEAALRRGASAFVLKSIIAEDLSAVIRQVMNGTVFQALDLGNAGSGETPSSAAGLTEREHSILQALARGLSNEAIAKELWITRQTVKFHVRNIYRKLGVSNRTEAARYAYQHSLVPNMVDDLTAAAAAAR